LDARGRRPVCPPPSARHWLQVSGITLLQVENFKYLGVVFTSDGRWNKQINTRIGKAKGSCACVLPLCGHKTLPNTAKLWVLHWSLFPSSPMVMTLGSWLKEYNPKFKWQR